MSIEENKRLIYRYINEVWNQGKLEVIDEIIANDYINHSPGVPDPDAGPDGLKPIILAMRNGFPDLHFEIHDLVITDNKVAIRSTMHGTHLGDLFGLQPTEKTVRVKQFQIEHIENNKIIEHWRQSDDMGMMRQLGQID